MRKPWIAVITFSDCSCSVYTFATKRAALEFRVQMTTDDGPIVRVFGPTDRGALPEIVE